jgi:hypothetical protein
MGEAFIVDAVRTPISHVGVAADSISLMEGIACAEQEAQGSGDRCRKDMPFIS